MGDKASGIGTLNLMDATSSFDTVGINVGNFGSGIVNVSTVPPLIQRAMDLSEEMPPVRG